MNLRKKTLIMFLSLVLGVPAFRSAEAATFLVNTASSTGPGSFYQAVQDANALGIGSVISFVPALAGATITLPAEAVIATDLNIDAANLGNAGPNLSGGDATRILTVNAGHVVNVNGLNFVSGNSRGGIAGLGGAILNYGTLTLTNCRFSGNFAPIAGGAIYNAGSLALTECVFSGNISSGQGGSVFSETVLLPTDCSFSGNHASNGGAMVVLGSATISRCTFSENSAAFEAGAILNRGNLSLTDSTVANNRCGTSGGGIVNAFTTNSISLIHCTVSGNTSDESGGGLAILAGTAWVTNSIVASNAAPPSAGADIYLDAGTLVAGNVNIVPVLNSTTNSTFIGTTPLTINPLLATLGNYGGPTQTMPPLPGSPAIDAGVSTPLTTDQRGSVRTVGAAPDVGAVESGGLWVQNNLNTGANSLRTILGTAGAITNSKIILFVPALSGGTILVTSQIVVTDKFGVTLDASSLPRGLTINGNKSVRAFYVTNGASASFRSLTISNCAAPGGSLSADGGGALFCRGRAELFNCTFVSNNVTVSPGYGGALANDQGDLRVTGCTLMGNSAASAGGAMYCLSGSTTLTNCTVAANSGGYGGGIVNDSSGLTMLHCTLSLNRATNVAQGGGGIGNFGAATLSMLGCIISGNITAGSRPDLWMQGGTLTATNCLIGDGSFSPVTNGVNGNIVGSTGLPINARLAPLTNYGGTTHTMPLLATSPAINAGGPTRLSTDQRGYPRRVSNAVDIGAVESIHNPGGPGTILDIIIQTNGFVRLSLTNLLDTCFPVLAASNPNLPLTNWLPVGFATDTPGAPGLIQFTDFQASSSPQRYYRLRAP